MDISIKKVVKFEVDSKEFNVILRALKKIKALTLYESLLNQRIQIAEQFHKDALQARNMYIELKQEEVSK